MSQEVDVTQPQLDLVAEILRDLRREGFIAEPTGTSDDYAVRSRGDTFAFRPVLTLPAALLSEYLEQMSRDIHDAPDPLAEALSLTMIHLGEELGTDHHEGRNYTRALGFRRGRGGRVEMFVDQDRPPIPARRPDPNLRWTAERPSEW